jgi:UDP-4-amino-4,6-dideoxy-N-acetyl-beta-L-altrosamine N-acetyltransferase
MIRLRALEREDLKQLRDWRNDPEIFTRVREYRYLNMENQEAWFNSLKDDRQTIMFGVEYLNRGWNLIGVCGLTNIDWVGRKAEVSIYIGNKEFRRKGLGREILDLLAKYAFEECNLNRLWAEVFFENLPGRKLFDKAGYKKEGILVSHAYKNGVFTDSHIYGLVRK